MLRAIRARACQVHRALRNALTPHHEGPTEHDVRTNELELAAAVAAVALLGYDRVKRDATSNLGAAWLLSGLTEEEWEFVARETRGDIAIANVK